MKVLQGPTWKPDLTAMGYHDPLPAPSPAVQATLASIVGPQIHDLIQTTDNASIIDKDEDGDPAPLLLTTLDLSHWTAILYVSTLDNGVERAIARVHEAHRVLANLLEKDELDLAEMTRNTHVVEAALRAANPHEDWSDRPPPTQASDSVVTTHPILGKLNIPNAEKAAIEDYSESIQNTQFEIELASQETVGKGPAIPFLPPRTVEVRLNTKSHRTWCLNNINLMAPIPVSVWRVWANLTDAEIKACEDKALTVSSSLSEGQPIPNAFPLALYDHYKCTTTSVMVHAKQDVLTCPPRHQQHTSKLWNCRRPYLRCACSQNAKSGCRGNMIWFDHSVWFMLNNLDRFFDARYPSSAAKFGAFLTWISSAALQAVRMQITFIAFRKLMEVAAVELAANPTEKLLAKYAEAPGARQVERLFKPATFSLETTPSPSPLPKKRRLNMNVTPDDAYQNQRGQNHYGRQRNGPDSRPNSHAGGRGRYNKNFRPAQQGNSWFQINPPVNPASPNPPSRSSSLLSERTPPSASASTVSIRPWSPVRGRVLNWDDV